MSRIDASRRRLHHEQILAAIIDQPRPSARQGGLGSVVTWRPVAADQPPRLRLFRLSLRVTSHDWRHHLHRGVAAFCSPIRIFRQHTLPLREGSAGIHGRVLDALSNTPTADLDVQIIEVDAGGVRGPGPRPRSAVTHTDAAGRFSVTGIGPGSYHIRVTGMTYLPSCIGTSREKSERCERVHVDDDQIQRDVAIFARPAAIIRGRVVDHDGRPKSGAFVSTICLGPEACLGLAKSDGAGRFEIGAIPPGDVTLSAEFPVNNDGNERAYYPGVWEIDEALPIAMIAGQPVNIEFRLPKVVMGSISARVIGPEGYRLDRFELSQSDQSL